MERISFVLIIFCAFIVFGCLKENSKILSSKKEKEKTEKINETGKPGDSTELFNKNSLWISFNKKLEGNVSFKKYQGKNVIVKGKFNYGEGKGGYGHFNLWNGEITDISGIEILSNQDRSKYLDVNELLNNPNDYKGKAIKAYGIITFGMENFEIKPIKKE